VDREKTLGKARIKSFPLYFRLGSPAPWSVRAEERYIQMSHLVQVDMLEGGKDVFPSGVGW